MVTSGDISSKNIQNIPKLGLNLLMLLPRISLMRNLEKCEKTVYKSKGGAKIIIEDLAGAFTRGDHLELARFLDKELLHNDHDLKCLSRVVIKDMGDTGEDGLWTFIFDQELDTFAAIISLNHTYLTTLEGLKETLAHEYGHHWTILHCIRGHWPEFKGNPRPSHHRLPKTYYEVREISPKDYHTGDIENAWHLCDKEVIAEDYRLLFAPAPYNQDHGVIAKMREDGLKKPILHDPQPDLIKKFIYSLGL